MPKFSFLSPLDQPLGRRRLLDDLKRCLSDDGLTEFTFSVAFAKIGPLCRLQEMMTKWKESGKKIRGIFGIDHYGTSIQALDFALLHMDDVYYTQHNGNSFHPKIYIFRGEHKAIIFIGSNNLTVGGTELNFEAMIELEFRLPEEAGEFEKAFQMIESLLPDNCPVTYRLTSEILLQLHSNGLLLDETEQREKGFIKLKYNAIGDKLDKAVVFPTVPSSGLPAHIAFKKILKEKEEKLDAVNSIEIMRPLIPVNGFAIQIKPHHNGEIFLSKTAAQQNPSFFGMPFTGRTIPKKGQNEGYPQRTPDPICNIVVFGINNGILLQLNKYSLNTVFYTTKGEVRVTASPLVSVVPDYSILIISLSNDNDIDYDMQIFTPDSPKYTKWLTICDQKMPGGGKEPRKYGWF